MNLKAKKPPMETTEHDTQHPLFGAKEVSYPKLSYFT